MTHMWCAYGEDLKHWTNSLMKATSFAIDLCHSGNVQGLITVSHRGFVTHRCVPTDHLPHFNRVLGYSPERLGGYYWFTMS